MAAYSTGANWSFPEDMPGAWEADEEAKPAREQSSPGSQGQDEATASPQDESPPKRRRTHYPPRQCRICLDVVQPTFHTDESSLPTAMQSAPRVTYESADGGRLLSPCKCKGSQKFVHEECLSAWRRADPMQKRNYWECPTCGYRYRLERLNWSSWINSTAAQLALTLAILFVAVFLLGFVADPIINWLNPYLDPIDTFTAVGGSTEYFVLDEESPGWVQHFIKGFAGLGLLGFANWLAGLQPLQWLSLRNTALITGRGGVGSGRNRGQQINLVLILFGVTTFLYTVWKFVRAWSRRALESASERVLDVPGADDDDDPDGDE